MKMSNVISGGASTRSKAPSKLPPGYPKTLARGEGSFVWDEAGTRYVDLMCSNAAATLGHAHPGVVTAITSQAALGGTFGLPHRLEEAVGERLCGVMGFDMVRWCCTGSEAVEGAMRIARIVTGRDVVVTAGQYHGWFSSQAVQSEPWPGVPALFRGAKVDVPFNDSAALESALASHPVAAVLLEPGRVEATHSGYLAGVVRLAHAHGALVIFDVIIMALRFSLRGWLEPDVRPDMVACGKALTSGAFPVGAILGPRAVMDPASQWVSGTHSGHPVGLAAVDAVLTAYRAGDVIGDIWDAGHTLACMVDGAQPAVWVTGCPAHPILKFETPGASSLFHSTLARHGVLAHPSGLNPSAALNRSREALDIAAKAFEAACRAIKEAEG